MKFKTLFTALILTLTIILGLGMVQSPTQATMLGHLAVGNSPNDPQTPLVATPNWNLLYIDGLDDQVDIGSDASIAFDLTSNTPYISYYNAKTKNLVLARLVNSGGNCGGGKWWCPDVDAAGDVGQGSSLAIHDKVSTVGGKLGISYYDATNKRLKFAQWGCTKLACTWSFYNFQSGDTQFDSGRYSSLKYNSKGEPQIAFYFNWNKPGPMSALKFCKWVGINGNEASGAFKCINVEEVNVLNSALYPSLALDPDDHPRIAYYDGQFENLRYAQEGANGTGTCFDKNWSCDWIDFTGDVGKYPSLDIVRVNGTTRTGIAYYDATNGKLKYAWPTSFNANCGPLTLPKHTWKCDTVNTMGVGITLPAVSLTLDEKANPYIAYQDYSAEINVLKLARNAGSLGLLVGNCGEGTGVLGPYQCDVIDSGGHVGADTNDGFFPSIARSSSGLINIAYKEYDYFYKSGTLKLAYQNFTTFLPRVTK